MTSDNLTHNQPDYELTLTIRNAPLLFKMREAGHKTVAELSRASGVRQTEIGKYLNLKKSAICKDGTITKSVQGLAEYFGCLPEDLFPPDHFYKELPQNKFTAYTNQEQLTTDTNDPPALLQQLSTPATFEDFLNNTRLTDREKEVLILRFAHNKTIEEVGRVFDVTRERIRQIETKALRKLRHPRNAFPLAESQGHPTETWEQIKQAQALRAENKRRTQPASAEQHS